MSKSRTSPIAFFTAACAAFGSGASIANAQINLTAGDVAIIGWADNISPNDVLTIVNLAPMPAGTVLYFTDNGWTGSAYRNTIGATDGDGNEQLLKFTANALIPAGTIIGTDTASPAYTWTTSGIPPGAVTGAFGIPALAQAGDQVYVFQHDTGNNPLNTATQAHLFVLDDTGVFENATSSTEGSEAAGLSVAGNTAVTFAQNSTGQNYMAFNTSTLMCGTKPEWLAAIANAANWTFGGSGPQPSGTINVNACPPAECWLFAGRGAGSAQVTVDGVTFVSQLGSIQQTWEVTMQDIPALPLPTRRVGANGLWKIDRPLVLSTQVVMYNPIDFPANPSQWSQRLQLYAAPNEQPSVTWHGSLNGINITYATFVGPDGKWYVHFPFTINGM